MYKYHLTDNVNSPDFFLIFLCMSYVTMVISSIILFNQIIKFNLFNFPINLSGAVIPYVFLYPISFIVLRIYGFKYVNLMIGAMILTSLIFVLMSKIIVAYSSNTTEIHNILSNSFKMYLAGFIGMPAGIYTSFLTLNFLNKYFIDFNTISLTISTIAGEIVNTIIVFPVGFHDHYSLYVIFSKIIIDAMLFKIIMGAILAIATIAIINIIANKKFNKL